MHKSNRPKIGKIYAYRPGPLSAAARFMVVAVDSTWKGRATILFPDGDLRAASSLTLTRDIKSGKCRLFE